jgi:cell wall-associated NlpC family hydrolase
MSHTRVFFVLCALAFTLAVVLVRPLGARADDGTTDPLVSTPDPTPAVSTTPLEHQVPVVKKTPAPVRKLQQSTAFGLRVVKYAKRFLGVPYVYGGSTPHGFDCSGFVRYVYAHFGVSLPHSSYAQFGDGRRVARGRLRPGDLVFFDGLGHVGLYVGNGRFIHAPHTGTRVRIETLAGWYSSRFSGARRLRNA